jgi:hypothetical protein
MESIYYRAFKNRFGGICDKIRTNGGKVEGRVIPGVWIVLGYVADMWLSVDPETGNRLAYSGHVLIFKFAGKGA